MKRPIKTFGFVFLSILFISTPVPQAIGGGAVDMLYVRDNLLYTQQNLQNQPIASQIDRWKLDQNILKKARMYNYKRDNIWKQAYRETGVKPLKATGTDSASKYSRGGIGDWDSGVTSKKNVRKLVAWFKSKGYTIVRGGGGSVTIKELDSTMFHHTRQGYLSKSAFMDNEMMSSFRLGKGELSYQKGYSIELSDNIKKLHGSLDMKTNKLLKPGKLQEMSKSTLRIQNAMDKYQSPGKSKGRSLKQLVDGIDDFWKQPGNRSKPFKNLNFKEKLTLIKGGYSPETVGIIDGNANAAVKQQQLEAFKQQCKTIVNKGYRQHLKVETDMENVYKKRIDGRLKSGKFREATRFRKEMIKNTAMKNYATEGMLREGNRKLLAEANGFKVDTVKHPKTGKPVRTYKPVGKPVPARFKKGGFAGGINQNQFDRYMRHQNTRKLIDLQKFGRTGSISKQIKISKAQADKILAQQSKKGFLSKPPKGIRTTAVSIGGGLVAAYYLYEAGKRSLNETELEISADTTDAQIAGKVAKHVAKTLYYTTPVAGLVDVADREYDKAAQEYDDAQARGEKPSLAWAVTKGTTKAVGEFSWAAVKAVTVKPVKDLNAIAANGLNTVVDVAGMIGAKADAREMKARVIDHRNRIGKRKAAVEKALAKMRVSGELGKPPKDWNNISPAYVMNHTTGYLERQMRTAQKDYRAAIKAGKGVRTPAANQALKRLNAYVGLVETCLKDPKYGKLIADAHHKQTQLNRTRQEVATSLALAGTKPQKQKGNPKAFAGQWSSNQGDMHIRVNGKRITGTYNLDGGRIFGTIEGDTLSGRWTENDSKVKCAERFKGSSHWGFVNFKLVNDKLYGGWEYCEGGQPGGEWNATRKSVPNPGQAQKSKKTGGSKGSETFSKPTIGGNRVDICLAWGSDCGQPAADAFCRKKGYAKALEYDIAKDIGAHSPTKIISSGKVCDQAYCDGFASITCNN